MASAREFLVAAQNADGGWGYKPGGMSFVEPTAAVVLALASVPETLPARRRAVDLLERLQRPDGGWGIAAPDDESGWMTGWATWALAELAPATAARGVQWLLRAQGLRVTDPTQAARVKQLLQIDPAITGWSWQPGDAAWIFPTALSLVALKRAGVHSHPRVQEAIAYLSDRAIPEGGWNIGNPFMVANTLPPTVVNTAVALVALNEHGAVNLQTERADAWLVRYLSDPATPDELAWIGWCRAMRGRIDPELARQLNGQALADGSWEHNPLTTALAMMAGAASPSRL